MVITLGPGLDSGRIDKHLTDIAESLRILETFKAVGFEEFCRDTKTVWAAEKGLERCIQNVLAVAAHVLAAVGGPVPDDYPTIIRALGDKRILPPDFAARIAPMAGFRKSLVHRYLEVDLREVYSAVHTRLDDFRTFAGYITGFVKENAPQSSKPGDV